MQNRKKVDLEEPFYYHEQSIRRRTRKSLCFQSVQTEAMLIQHAATPLGGVLWKQQSSAASVREPREFSHCSGIITSPTFPSLLSAPQALSAGCGKGQITQGFANFQGMCFPSPAMESTPCKGHASPHLRVFFLSLFAQSKTLLRKSSVCSQQGPCPRPAWLHHQSLTEMVLRRTLWRRRSGPGFAPGSEPGKGRGSGGGWSQGGRGGQGPREARAAARCRAVTREAPGFG